MSRSRLAGSTFAGRSLFSRQNASTSRSVSASAQRHTGLYMGILTATAPYPLRAECEVGASVLFFVEPGQAHHIAVRDPARCGHSDGRLWIIAIRLPTDWVD